MRKAIPIVALSFLAFGIALVGLSRAQEGSSAAPPPAASAHVVFTPGDIKWGDMPSGLPAMKGAQMTVLAGDPGAPGVFTVRMKAPAGYKVYPHWHPTDEHVTVISGTCLLGAGDKFETSTMTTLPAGGFAWLPAEMHHYVMCKSAVVLQISGNGPFAINYINPSDDPRTKAEK